MDEKMDLFESKNSFPADNPAVKYTNGEWESHPTRTFTIQTTEAGGPQPRAQGKVKTNTSDSSSAQFPRISRPVELLRPSYDVVVIGSGYGGGVASSRMARGRQSVCLLERGKEKWPGEFPSGLKDALKELHVSGEFSPDDKKGKFVEGGDPTGLYHLVLGEGQNAFIGNGLGGTSLLNANVFLEMDPGVMKLDYWPNELKNKAVWDKYYARARGVLEPAKYPLDFPELPKLNLLQKQAERIGLGNKFYRVPQTTRFIDGPNSTGVEMQASALTGMDATGINDGSKSTTLVNYLSDAWNWGAEIFCECEVRYVKKAPNGDGYIVYFAWHGSKRGAFKNNIYQDLMWVHAKKFVFLGAGSLGTTEILLRSKAQGLKVSDAVGTGMSGNGDILAFGYNTEFEANSVGNPAPLPDHPIGPCITGVVDCRDQLNPLDGFVIEEGTVPQSLSNFYQAMLEQLPGAISPTGLSAYQKVESLLARFGSKILGPYFPKGSVEKTQVYLIMSHDSNQAILTLRNDKPILKFLGVGRSEHVKQLNGILAQASAAVGGTFVQSPFYAALGQQEITVHAIGGAGLSNDGTGFSGATNHVGEVFMGNDEEVHEGLVVCDGALVPAALGVNPFATITALAERAVELIAEKRHIQIDYETANGILDLFGKPAFPVLNNTSLEGTVEMISNASYNHTAGIGFTEVMSGFIHIGDDVKDFDLATKIAQSSCEAARFFLSVKSWNTKDFVSNSSHSSLLTGTFSCAGLRGPFMVLRGDFQLFNQDPREPDCQNLTYNFDLINPSGEKLRFNGYKVVNPSVAFDALGFWKATSTLYVTITQMDRKVIGRGILHIQPTDFASELASVSAVGPSLYSRVKSTASFLNFFTKQAANIFFTPFSFLSYPTSTFNDYINVTVINQTYTLIASDGVHSTLQMWNPIGKGSNDPAPTILFIPGAAVDHQIFALPTIEKNAIDYFREAGYRCYCVTHRVGKTMAAHKGYTTFDARLDIRAALEYIRSLQEAQLQSASEKVYVVAHCAGSVALSCGMLDGTVPAEYISGVTASNVFMTPIFAKVNMIKASQPVPLNSFYAKFIGSWFSCSSTREDSLVQQAINQILRLYPVGERKELCNSVVCHRSSLVFGRLWSHRNLNAATHSQLSHFLGGTSMVSLGHLMAMGRAGYVMTNPPTSINLVTPSNMSRLRGVPIFFFSGSENTVYDPQNTDVSYTMLRDAFGADDYERTVFEGRGHLDCWMGKDAVKDVYPRVRKHVDQVMKVRAAQNGYQDGQEKQYGFIMQKATE
jgi:choline dehydrogenase-like flavoprotein